MYPDITHIHMHGNKDYSSLVFFAGNGLMSIQVKPEMFSLQTVSLIVSIVAGIYVIYDHHLKIKWKRKNAREDKERRKKDGYAE